jgi:hypothetical protein
MRCWPPAFEARYRIGRGCGKRCCGIFLAVLKCGSPMPGMYISECSLRRRPERNGADITVELAADDPRRIIDCRARQGAHRMRSGRDDKAITGSART